MPSLYHSYWLLTTLSSDSNSPKRNLISKKKGYFSPDIFSIFDIWIQCRHHLPRFERFHVPCLQRILRINWGDKVAYIDIRMRSVYSHRNHSCWSTTALGNIPEHMFIFFRLIAYMHTTRKRHEFASPWTQLFRLLSWPKSLVIGMPH